MRGPGDGRLESRMKKRTKRQLERMHVWTHRRLHDAIPPRYFKYWLDVRTKIQELIVNEAATVSLDEWLQIAAAQKIADQDGFKLNWRREHGGIIISMGKSNENLITTNRRQASKYCPS